MMRARETAVMKACCRCLLTARCSRSRPWTGSPRPQSYPTRPVTLVVPFAPGGGTEFLARMLAQRLEQRLGKPFVIENRPGAGGVTGALSVARAAPDGHTLLMAPSPVMAINVALHKKLPYDPAADFVPLALVVISPYVLVVNPSLPVQSVADLIRLAKEQARANSRSRPPGAGTPHHLFSELLKSMTGIEMTHVPYRGSIPALTDVAGRARAAHVLRYPACARSAGGAQAARARRFDQGTRRRVAGRGADCRARRTRLRRRLLADGGRARSHAEGHRRAAARRDQGLHGAARDQGTDRQARACCRSTRRRWPACTSSCKSEIARWGKLVEQAGVAGSQ